MEILRSVVFYAHLVGFALLLGSSVAQYVSGKIRINPVMVWGAGIQLVTGLVLAAPWGEEDEDDANPAKLAVKLVIAIMVFVMTFVPRRRETVNPGHFMAIVGLVLANAAVAVFW